MFIERLKEPRRLIVGNVELTIGAGLALAEVSACASCHSDTTWAVAHICVR